MNPGVLWHRQCRNSIRIVVLMKYHCSIELRPREVESLQKKQLTGNGKNGGERRDKKGSFRCFGYRNTVGHLPFGYSVGLLELPKIENSDKYTGNTQLRAFVYVEQSCEGIEINRHSVLKDYCFCLLLLRELFGFVIDQAILLWMWSAVYLYWDDP